MANVKKLTVEDLKKIKGARATDATAAPDIRAEDSEGNKVEVN